MVVPGAHDHAVLAQTAREVGEVRGGQHRRLVHNHHIVGVVTGSLGRAQVQIVGVLLTLLDLFHSAPAPQTVVGDDLHAHVTKRLLDAGAGLVGGGRDDDP